MASITFPIMDPWKWSRRRPDDEDLPPRPASIPWALIAPHLAQALRNHDQSLLRLAERGGLCPSEALAVLEDRRWHAMSEEEASAALKEMVERAPDYQEGMYLLATGDLDAEGLE